VKRFFFIESLESDRDSISSSGPVFWAQVTSKRVR
jgi:hypothetical protein